MEEEGSSIQIMLSSIDISCGVILQHYPLG